MSLMEPGRSMGSSLALFSAVTPASTASRPDDEIGELRFSVPVAVDPITAEELPEELLDAAVAAGEAVDGEDADDGFFNPLRDGGGGASSIRPCERNCELYVLTVLTRFSGLRTSIEIEAFLLGMVVDLATLESFALVLLIVLLRDWCGDRRFLAAGLAGLDVNHHLFLVLFVVVVIFFLVTIFRVCAFPIGCRTPVHGVALTFPARRRFDHLRHDLLAVLGGDL
uniref:Uncharacterized protein n=1 Tax=Anopheles melas TaxID=34690 RepID=A0A182U1U5_9DIPT